MPNYSAAQDIRDYLIDEGYTSVYTNHLPDEPNVATCVYDYAGEPDSQAMGSKNICEQYPRVQVLCRDKNGESAYNRIYGIYLALGGAIGLTINGNIYDLITALQMPFLLGRADDANRYLYACNFRISRKPVL